MKSRNNKNQKGFTLIEIMVSVALFVVVMVIAVGSIFSIVGANRKSKNMNIVINNLNFSFESMIRDLRTGSDYDVTSDNSITFMDRNCRIVEYSLAEEGIVKSYDRNECNSDEDVSSLPQGLITGSDVSITEMEFILKGEGVGNGQHILLIHLKGEVGADKTKSSFNIETLITPRDLDSADLI